MDTSSIQIQALITFLAPFFIQLAKRSQSLAFSWIDQNKPKVCVLTSGLAALATSMGIQFVHSPHSVTVTWPDGSTLAHGFTTFLVSALIQFVGQHALYEGLWKHVLSTGVGSQETGGRS